MDNRLLIKYEGYFTKNNEFKKVYNIGDIFSNTVYDTLYDDNKLRKIEGVNKLCFIGSEIPKWASSKTMCCGLGWRQPNLKLEHKNIPPENFCYVRGKISRQNVIDGGVAISQNLPIGDTGLLASLIVKNDGVDKRYDIGIITHVRTMSKGNQLKKIAESIYTKSKIAVVSMGDSSIRVDDMLRFIQSCRIVVTNSLYAIIFSHSFGVPALYFNNEEGSYKFKDYYSVYDSINYNIDNAKFENVIKRCCDDAYVKSVQPKDYEVKAIQKRIMNALPYKEAFSVFANKLINKLNKKSIKYYDIGDKCVGCGACYIACKKHAIDIRKEGLFRYPDVTSECVECGVCSNVCPVLVQNDDKIALRHVAARTRSSELLMNASSGGIVTEFMKSFINNGGVCFGVAFSNSRLDSLRHILVNDYDSLKRTIGSKYLEVENFDHNCYNNVRKMLNDKLDVLFVGTPCQVVGLKRYLSSKNVDDTSLYCIELMCHGTPSKDKWNEYKEDLEEKYCSKIKSFNFRDKSTGWTNYSVSWEFENGNKYSEIYKKNDYMMKYFLSDKFLRPSCTDCKFKKRVSSGADLIIGDLWGINKIHDIIKNDDKGMCLCNILTDKGMELIKKNHLMLDIETIPNDKYKLVEQFRCDNSTQNNKINANNTTYDSRNRKNNIPQVQYKLIPFAGGFIKKKIT